MGNSGTRTRASAFRRRLSDLRGELVEVIAEAIPKEAILEAELSGTDRDIIYPLSGCWVISAMEDQPEAVLAEGIYLPNCEWFYISSIAEPLDLAGLTVESLVNILEQLAKENEKEKEKEASSDAL